MKKYIYLFSIFVLSCTSENNNSSNNSSINNSTWIPGSDFGKPLKEYSSTNSNLVCAKVTKMVVYNNELYVGGDFKVIGGQIIPFLAKWNGVSWSSIGSINSPVEDMIVFQNKLYIQIQEYNNFQYSDCNKIYSWNGSVLLQEQMNYNFNTYPLFSKRALNYGVKKEQWAIHDNKLFVYVKTPDSFGVNNFALFWFDGNSWNTDWDFNFHHGILTSFQGNLYATVNAYEPITGNESFGLFRFNGDFDNAQQSQGWENITGTSLTQPKIHTIANYNNKLIVGGDFETIGGILSQYIAAYNGNSWSTFGNWPYEPNELKVLNNKLYASFYNGNYNGLDFDRIALYNAGSWNSILYNLSDFDLLSDGIHNTIEYYNGYLYLGGDNTVFSTNNFVKLSQ